MNEPGPDPRTTIEHPSRTGRFLFVGIGLVGVLVALYFFVGRDNPRSAKPELPDITQLEEGDDPDIPPVLNPGYLGPQACVECHAKRVAEFSTTAHARACRRPTDGPMPTGFATGSNRFTTSDRALRFTMKQAGTLFTQTLERNSAPDSITRIDLVYGANKADEVFFNWENNRISELMAVWLHPLNRWGHSSYDHRGTGGFTRETTPRCLECHNTWMNHVPGTVNEYVPEGTILGTTCEKCHGPAREHVTIHRANPTEKSGRNIVNPSRLSRERGIEVCTQCHGNAVKPRGPAFTYRPGQPLDEFFRTAESRHPEEDHVANQVKYLRQSKCFQKSEMTCATCHDPHKPHAAVEKDAMQKSCMKCHQPAGCKDRPNLPEAVRDNCIGCHMPQRVWMNVHFHTEDDRYVPPIRRYQHRIAVDRLARSEVLLDHSRGAKRLPEAERLQAELVKHWMAEYHARRNAQRFIAAIGAAREVLRIDPANPDATAALRQVIDDQTRLDRDMIDAMRVTNESQYPVSISLYESILTRKPDLALAHSKLGTLLAATGRKDLAIPHLEAVDKFNPDDGSGLAMRAWLAYLDGRAKDAVELYRRAIAIEPFDAKLNYHLGLALLQMKEWAEAANRFREARTIDPRHAGAHQGLSHALRELGQSADAIRFARVAARLTNFEHADVLETLAEAYSAAGRVPEAAAAAALVLDRDSTLSLETRRRMNELRDHASP